ncbi:MAG: site-2 protease family protein [Anaerolineales bacterium]|nr:site-2 protease family protein [Anaerolineales bacterium]
MLFGNLDPATLFARLIVLLIAFTIHEFAHAWTATQFGDDTPRQYGRLTLNPFAHLDPIGSLVLLFAGFGWAKPVPVNPYALQRRSSSALMWVSLAGPLSNLLLAILAAVPFRVGLADVYEGFTVEARLFPTFSQFLVEFLQINLVLMLFNLIPLAPLDGEKVLEYFAPPNWAPTLDSIRPYGPMILLVIVIVLPMFGIDLIGWIIGPPLQALLLLLVG